MRVDERPLLREYVENPKLAKVERTYDNVTISIEDYNVGPVSSPASRLKSSVIIRYAVKGTPTVSTLGKVNSALRGTDAKIEKYFRSPTGYAIAYKALPGASRRARQNVDITGRRATLGAIAAAIPADVLIDPLGVLPGGMPNTPIKEKPAKMIRIDATPGHHEYVPSKKLLSTWGSVMADAERTGRSMHLYFVGPSGSGKTHGAEYLAGSVGLDFVKVDAAAMVDPESWFGTREIVVEEGVSVTRYNPSAFVEAIERECVLFIDEINRIKDAARNILLPLLDGTRQVTNPLTGQTVTKHPKCFVIMAGNVGFAYTGTYAVDPALTTRALTLGFEYLKDEHEIKVAMQETGCEQHIATGFVRFAKEIRDRAARADSEIQPMSTREVISACRLVAAGLDPDTAAEVAIINGVSSEGGAESPQAAVKQVWVGIRPLLNKPDPEKEAPDATTKVDPALRVKLDANGQPVIFTGSNP